LWCIYHVSVGATGWSPSSLLRPRAERLRLKRAIAELEIRLGSLCRAGFVQRPAKFFVEHHVCRDGEVGIHQQRIAKPHHIKPHGGNSEVDFHCFRRHVGNALDDGKTFFQELIGGHYFIGESDAQRLRGVDMIAHQTVANRVLESG